MDSPAMQKSQTDPNQICLPANEFVTIQINKPVKMHYPLDK